jgi:hypothetical protein
VELLSLRKAELVVDNYSADDLAKAGRLKQIRMVARLIHQQNRWALPITIGAALGVIAVFVLVGLFTGIHDSAGRAARRGRGDDPVRPVRAVRAVRGH